MKSAILKTSFALAWGAIAVVLQSCVHKPMCPTGAQLVAILEREMLSNSGWIRIHAADALLDNGCDELVARVFEPESGVPPPPYRVGIWRVMARASGEPRRQFFVEQIRSVLLDPESPDRISAAETLAKLRCARRSDRLILSCWLETADDAAAAFPRWLMVLSSDPSERPDDEASLAALLRSSDPIARLRSAFALGRLQSISAASLALLRSQLAVEPRDSVARPYIITALLLQSPDGRACLELEKESAVYLRGRPNEQLESATVIGLRRQPGGSALLTPLLYGSEADGRIGAANGLLKLNRHSGGLKPQG